MVDPAVKMYYIAFMQKPDYRVQSRLISNVEAYSGEKLRQWTEWNDLSIFQTINNLDSTKLKWIPLFIWRSGTSQCSEKFIREHSAKARFRMFGIELVTAGNAVVIQNGKQFTINPGEAFLLHNYTDRIWKTGDAGFLHKRFINIDGTLLDAMLRSTNLAAHTHIKPQSPQRIAQLFKQANMLLGTQGPGHQNLLMKLAFEILLEISSSVRFDKYPPPINAALEIMNKRIRTDLTLPELAKAANVSASHLSHMFDKFLGVSPLNFYLRLKTEYAKTLLNDPKYSVKQISEMCGYNDPYFFSKQFKRFSGFSPKTYRNAGRG
jgi:AraC-like DNA-binding protein